MSDYQNEQRPPEDLCEAQNGTSNQASPSDAPVPPEGGGYPPPQEYYQPPPQGYQPPPQGYQPPLQGYQPPQGYLGYPPSWNNPHQPRPEHSTAEKVFKIIGITFIIIAGIIAFAVAGCFALIFLW